MEPDFELRHLEDYTEKDLTTLYVAVGLAKHYEADQQECQTLDVWGYRIKDAIAVARKRENETHPLK